MLSNGVSMLRASRETRIKFDSIKAPTYNNSMGVLFSSRRQKETTASGNGSASGVNQFINSKLKWKKFSANIY